MTIVLLALGSRGDTQPYVALGRALSERGHDVDVATFSAFEDLVRGAGLGFRLIPGDIARIVTGAVGSSAGRADNPLKFILSIRQLRTLVADLQGDLFDACQGADAIIYHPGATIGFFAARAQGVPSILATPFPMTPTRTYPSPIFYHLPRFGGAANALTHRVLAGALWSSSRSAIGRFWRERFGRAPDDLRSPYPQQRSARAPTIVGCSEHVFPTPSDWPEHVHTTGYWFLDDPDWRPPAPLRRFLDGGEPPVYIGFGNLGERSTAAATAALAIDALERSGKRGILATGLTDIAEVGAMPESVHVLDGAPHSWLFPRTAAVVHHGGAGTTAAALRAGVPSVIVPHGNDQPGWARRVHELGAAAPPIPRRRLSAEALARGIDTTARPELRTAAARLAALIDRERGAERAADIVGRALGS
jgi:sterol 3beta-glucosyltransferase